MIMMMIRENQTSAIDVGQITNSKEPTSNEHIISTSTTSTSTSMWKLYENPFYHSHQKQLIHYPSKQFHHHHRINARKLATSFWDVRFIGPVMGSELDRAKAQIIELKAELELERKARKKLENVNKKLVREVSEERQGRETLERVCEELGKKVSVNKAEMREMKREIVEERKMLRMAEVFREERVQMKLNEAKFLLEEKISEFDRTKLNQNQNQNQNQKENFDTSSLKCGDLSKEETKYESEEKNLRCKCDHKAGVLGTNSMLVHQRKPSPEPENPHIKRGIKGFVEFPKVVRAMGSKNRLFGTKLECQKAQLNLLLKQKSPMRSSNIIVS